LSDIAFRQLILAKSLTVAQAAEKYGCSDRNVRLWLAKWPIGVKICDGRHRISEPLLQLCVCAEPVNRTNRHRSRRQTVRSRLSMDLCSTEVC
jgi:hypothetical protein